MQENYEKLVEGLYELAIDPDLKSWLGHLLLYLDEIQSKKDNTALVEEVFKP